MVTLLIFVAAVLLVLCILLLAAAVTFRDNVKQGDQEMPLSEIIVFGHKYLPCKSDRIYYYNNECRVCSLSIGDKVYVPCTTNEGGYEGEAYVSGFWVSEHLGPDGSYAYLATVTGRHGFNYFCTLPELRKMGAPKTEDSVSARAGALQGLADGRQVVRGLSSLRHEFGELESLREKQARAFAKLAEMAVWPDHPSDQNENKDEIDINKPCPEYKLNFKL